MFSEERLDISHLNTNQIAYKARSLCYCFGSDAVLSIVDFYRQMEPNCGIGMNKILSCFWRVFGLSLLASGEDRSQLENSWHIDKK